MDFDSLANQYGGTFTPTSQSRSSGSSDLSSLASQYGGTFTPFNQDDTSNATTSSDPLATIQSGLSSDRQTLMQAAGSYLPGLIKTYADSVPDFLNAAGSGQANAGDIGADGNPIGEGTAMLRNIGEGSIRAGASLTSTVFAPIAQAVQSIADAATDNPTVQNLANGILRPLADVGDKLEQLRAAHPEAAQNIDAALGFLPYTEELGGSLAKPLGDVMKPVTDSAKLLRGSEDNAPNFTGPTKELGGTQDNLSGVQDQANNNPIVSKRIQTLSNLENNSSYLRRIVANADKYNIDVKSLVSNTDLLQGSVDDSGTIRTTEKGGPLSQFNEFMDKYESAVSDGLKREGKSIPLDTVKTQLMDMVNNSRIAGASKIKLNNLVNDEIKGLELDTDENGMIKLSKIQDAKISTTNDVDYTNPSSKINAKSIAQVYRGIIEKESNLPVKGVNSELAKYETIKDYLEALDGKKVKGGRLGGYFAKTIGGMAGSFFGPLGVLIGAEVAGKIRGTLLERTFGGLTGGSLDASPGLKNQVMQNNLPRIGLPAPRGGPATELPGASNK